MEAWPVLDDSQPEAAFDLPCVEGEGTPAAEDPFVGAAAGPGGGEGGGRYEEEEDGDGEAMYDESTSRSVSWGERGEQAAAAAAGGGGSEGVHSSGEVEEEDTGSCSQGYHSQDGASCSRESATSGATAGSREEEDTKPWLDTCSTEHDPGGGIPFPDASTKRVPPPGKEGELSLAELMALHSTTRDVSRYCRMCLDKLLPAASLGGQENRRKVMAQVSRFVELGRWEELPLHTIMRGIATNQLTWLQSPKRQPTTPTAAGATPAGGSKEENPTAPVSRSEALKRSQLAGDFVHWLFSVYLVPLLRASFYCTEIEHQRYKVFYFRKPLWNRISRLGFERLQGGGESQACNMVQLSRKQAQHILSHSNRSLGYAALRFLPKARELRPIANLSRKSLMLSRNFQAINRALDPLFQVLQYEVRCRPELLGATVFSLDDIYFKLSPWIRRLKGTSGGGGGGGGGKKGPLPRVYAAALDINKCFDSIPQRRLCTMVEGMLREDEYLIHRYCKLACALGQPRLRYAKHAAPPGQYPSFLRLAEELSGKLHDVVLTDLVQYPYVDQKGLSKLLKEHIFHHLVKVGPRFCWQTKGIPQGSVLSSLLCNCFYASMEKEKLTPAMRGEGEPHEGATLLMRLMDDYLMLTTESETAACFVNQMHQGFPEYGCRVNPAKTVVNFDLSTRRLLPTPNEEDKWVAWCGLQIDPSSLEVRYDYTRYSGIDMASTVSIVYGKHPGQAFFRKLCGVLKGKIHPLVLDSSCLSEHTAAINVYHMLLLAAVKGHCMAKALARQHTVLSPVFLRCAVHGLAHYAQSRITTLAQGTKFAKHGFGCRVNPKVIEALNLRAWLTVLKSRHAAYCSLLKALRRDGEAKRAGLSQAEIELLDRASGGDRAAPAFLRNMRY